MKSEEGRTLTEGARCFLCIGPQCWGKAFSAEQAYQNARKEYRGTARRGQMPRVMFDAPADAVIDGMGGIVWTPSLYSNRQEETAEEMYRRLKPIELYRVGMPSGR